MNEMLIRLDKRLEEIQAKQLRLDKLQKRQTKAQAEQQRLEQETAVLRQTLAKESRDVERLEKLSLTALFYTVLGSKEEQLDKEKQEQLAAQLKYDEHQYALETLQAERQELEQEIAQLGNLEQAYQDALNAKASLLEQTPHANDLFKVTEKLTLAQANLREIEEAHAAGLQAGELLDQGIQLLQKAGSWGTWDMLGGGMLISAIKHSNIDKAKTAVVRAQDQLRRFEKELADIDLSTELMLSFDGLTTFADFFFDSLIFDWVVQNKIEASLKRTVEIGNQVVELLRTLREARKETQAHITTLEAEREKLIRQAAV